MNWKTWIFVLCGIVLLVSAVLSQAPRGNRQTRPQTRPGANRRNRGRGGSRRRVSSRRRVTTPLPTASPTSTECEMIYVPMCRGMVDYTHTRLPNQFGHTTQVEVYRALEYMWAFMDIGCSADFRVTACGFYLPKCTPGRTGVELPCKETCNRARKCKKRMKQLQSSWPTTFRCRSLKSYREGGCIRPVPRIPSCNQSYLTCEENSIDMCQNLPFPRGSLPNMFLQCNRDQIKNEMAQYQDLVDSRCSPHIRFFLCGIYMPYCVRAENPFALPCQEICEDVRSGCEAVYRRNRANLPWPNKFQCHRYPASTNARQVCASPSDVTLRMPDIQLPTGVNETTNRPPNRRPNRRPRPRPTRRPTRTQGRRRPGRRPASRNTAQ